MPKTAQRKAKAFRAKLKPVPQPKKARARPIPNSLFARTLDVPVEIATGLLRDMYRIRHLEEAVFALSQENRLPALPLSSGLEAVAVGSCAALHAGDLVASHHRGHGHCLARGIPLPSLLAEIVGHGDGLCGGTRGSQRLIAPVYGFLGSSPLAADGAPLAAGAALALQRENNGRVALCFLDDDAVIQGAFFETLHLAASWHLPLVLVHEHVVSGERRSRKGARAEAPSERAESFGLATAACDGMRVLDVREAVTAACERARAGGGATLIEATAQRYPVHELRIAPDELAPADLEQWRSMDPLAQFRIVLAETETVLPAAADAIEQGVLREIKEALAALTEPAMPRKRATQGS